MESIIPQSGGAVACGVYWYASGRTKIHDEHEEVRDSYITVVCSFAAFVAFERLYLEVVLPRLGNGQTFRLFRFADVLTVDPGVFSEQAIGRTTHCRNALRIVEIALLRAHNYLLELSGNIENWPGHWLYRFGGAIGFTFGREVFWILWASSVLQEFREGSLLHFLVGRHGNIENCGYNQPLWSGTNEGLSSFL